jgi:hypothetical protein
MLHNRPPAAAAAAAAAAGSSIGSSRHEAWLARLEGIARQQQREAYEQQLNQQKQLLALQRMIEQDLLDSTSATATGANSFSSSLPLPSDLSRRSESWQQQQQPFANNASPGAAAAAETAAAAAAAEAADFLDVAKPPPSQTQPLRSSLKKVPAPPPPPPSSSSTSLHPMSSSSFSSFSSSPPCPRCAELTERLRESEEAIAQLQKARETDRLSERNMYALSQDILKQVEVEQQRTRAVLAQAADREAALKAHAQGE